MHKSKWHVFLLRNRCNTIELYYNDTWDSYSSKAYENAFSATYALLHPKLRPTNYDSVQLSINFKNVYVVQMDYCNLLDEEVSYHLKYWLIHFPADVQSMLWNLKI